MEEAELNRIDNYYSAVKVIAERSHDEYSDVVAQICDDALSFTFGLYKKYVMKEVEE